MGSRQADRETAQRTGGRLVIYGLVDPRDGSIRYVGRTANVKSRYAAHCSLGVWWRADNQRRRAWLEELQDRKLKPLLTELEAVPTFEAAVAAEERWIAKGRAEGWPLTNGHGSGLAGGVTEDAKRLRARRRAPTPPSAREVA